MCGRAALQARLGLRGPHLYASACLLSSEKASQPFGKGLPVPCRSPPWLKHTPVCHDQYNHYQCVGGTQWPPLTQADHAGTCPHDIRWDIAHPSSPRLVPHLNSNSLCHILVVAQHTSRLITHPELSPQSRSSSLTPFEAQGTLSSGCHLSTTHGSPWDVG